jgi:biofilm protein TabA
MVVTDLEHVQEQLALTPSLQKAIDFLERTRGQELADGREEVDGDKVYALVQSYDTAAHGAEIVFEAHRKYIDVQYVALGREVIGWAYIDRVTVTAAYDEAKDAWFGTRPASETAFVWLNAGQLAVLHPTDAHAPRLAAGAPAHVKKVVVKVAVGS